MRPAVCSTSPSDRPSPLPNSEPPMLGDNDAIATIAVKNLPDAKRFYQDTLGLKPVDAEGKELIMFQSGQTRVNVYHSEFAGTNRATACTWAVGDRFDEIVKSLKAKGVRFEH